VVVLRMLRSDFGTARIQAKQFLRNPELHAWAVTDIDTPKDLKAILWREGGF